MATLTYGDDAVLDAQLDQIILLGKIKDALMFFNAPPFGETMQASIPHFGHAADVLFPFGGVHILGSTERGIHRANQKLVLDILNAHLTAPVSFAFLTATEKYSVIAMGLVMAFPITRA